MENNPNSDSDVPAAEIPAGSTPASNPPESAADESVTTTASPAATEGVPEPQAEVCAPVSVDTDIPESEDRPPMEAESESAESPTESPDLPGTAEPAIDGEADPLLSLALRAQRQRLSAAEEEQAVNLLKESLLSGRAGMNRAVEALTMLPWMVGVNAVGAAWPELKPVFRTQLFAGLAKIESDHAKRMRLSLARGLFKQDIPIALKIATTVAREMRDKETGTISGKNAQIFANVLIGRAKPWIGQVPLAELKPADADALVHSALFAAFSLPHAPITQLGVVKWAAEGGKLAKLHPSVTEAATKSLARWSAKWQGALRREVADLPEALLAVLKEPTAEPEAPRDRKPQERGGRRQAATPQPDVDADAESAEAATHPPAGDEPDAEGAAAAVRDGDAETTETPAPAPEPKPRPVYESKTVPRRTDQTPQAAAQPAQPARAQQAAPSGKVGQNLREAAIPELLRAVEAQFQNLKSELSKAETKLRQKDDDLRRAQKKQPERLSVPVIDGEPTPDELARLNRQLENRNLELQARIEELTADAEARAVSVGAVTDQPVDDPNAQLRTLLVLKLQEDYEDFVALERESPDVVVQQHYRTVLRHVFEVLTTEGVQFQKPPEPI
jgi:hypothetical protein